MISLYLGILLFSFVFNSFLMVPFINLLYRLKFQRQKQKTKDPFNKLTPIFDFFNKKKAGVPIGGGVLIVTTTLFLYIFFLFLFYLFSVPIISIFEDVFKEAVIVFFTFFSFAFLGFYDDAHKIFTNKKHSFFGLRLRHKLIIEIVLSLIISYWLYYWLGINFIHIPFFGVFELGFFYVFFAAFVIIAFANAFNITDGLDGLAGGILLINVLTFWVISAALLDTVLSVFLAIWIGALITFLYFNVHPARIILGDTGSLSFGATFAIIGLLLGKALLLPIIGLVFVAEITSSLLQLLSKHYLHRKFFPVAPLHLYFQLKGWGEPKIVFRLWLTAIIASLFGLWIAFLK
jgi:phospho-N-acetylmuramoyl-pentapeptide-transferase